MVLKLKSNSYFIFDLDDTLYKEIDFLKSGYRAIADLLKEIIQCDVYSLMITRYFEGQEVFQYILDLYEIKKIKVNDLLRLYREHIPKISLSDDVREFLNILISFKFKIGLISDGRSLTQRNKLKALNIEQIFDKILISEEYGSRKPDIRNFEIFEQQNPDHAFIYFGDNINKDFISPKKLNWLTICLLDSGTNIHKQNFNIDKDYLPHKKIKSFNKIKIIYE